MRGYIVVWWGRPMRDAAPGSLLKKERGRLFTGCGRATVWPTYAAARRALRRSVKAWSKEGANSGTDSGIGTMSRWSVVRLQPARKEKSAKRGRR
jgi:hypothetical protein